MCPSHGRLFFAACLQPLCISHHNIRLQGPVSVAAVSNSRDKERHRLRNDSCFSANILFAPFCILFPKLPLSILSTACCFSHICLKLLLLHEAKEKCQEAE